MTLYRERLEQICKTYKTVVMLGDSMGATAALLFAPLATSVLAFCPQVPRKSPAEGQADIHVSIVLL